MSRESKAIDALMEKLGDRYDDAVMQIRARHIPLWMEISGADTPEGIDYDNPHIRIQWELCDPRVLYSLKRPGGVEAFAATLTEEEREIFFNYRDPDDGSSYLDLAEASWMREVMAQISPVRRIRERRKQRITK